MLIFVLHDILSSIDGFYFLLYVMAKTRVRGEALGTKPPPEGRGHNGGRVEAPIPPVEEYQD